MEIDIPSLLRIKPGAIDRLGKYLKQFEKLQSNIATQNKRIEKMLK